MARTGKLSAVEVTKAGRRRVLHDGGISNSGIPGRPSSRSGGRGDEPQPHRSAPPIERMKPPSMIADF